MSIPAVLKELNLSFREIGKEGWCLCPFHNREGVHEHHPSFSVNLSTGLFNCFSCGAKGNLAFLASRVKNITYSEAVLWVNSIAGWSRAHKWREDFENKEYAPPDLKVSEADLALFTDVPEEILAGRNITASQAKLFGVRYMPDNNSWIFPVREPYTNRLWGWQEKFNDTRRFTNYPAGIRKSLTLFGMDVAVNGSPVVLVESPVDAVRVSDFSAGSGLSGWGVQVSDFQLSIIQQCTESIVLALDNDSAGVRETARICESHRGSFKRIRVFNYGDSVAKDPGEMTDDEIRYGLDNAVPALRWLRYDKKL